MMLFDSSSNLQCLSIYYDWAIWFFFQRIIIYSYYDYAIRFFQPNRPFQFLPLESSLRFHRGHHFVLELWNSIVASALQSAHYPDRAKLGLLWGMEEMMGPWFGASNSNHGGVPSRNSTNSSSRRFASMASVGSLGARATPPETEARELPTPSLEEVRGQGPVLENVFLLETTGPMRLAELPKASGYAGYVSGIQVDTSNWANICLPGLEEHAVRLAETIYNFDIQELAQLLEIPLPSNSFARFSSLSVSKWEYCFVVLRGKELRLAVHFVGPKKLFLLSGDALQRKESDWQWLVEDRHNLSAIGRAFQRKEDLQNALRRSAWRRLFGDRDEPFEPVFKDLWEQRWTNKNDQKRMLEGSSHLIHPGRLTWTIIMEVWKIIFLSKWVICSFHVNLPGCTWLVTMMIDDRFRRQDPGFFLKHPNSIHGSPNLWRRLNFQ